jgi:hypothetical protein
MSFIVQLAFEVVMDILLLKGATPQKLMLAL